MKKNTIQIMLMLVACCLRTQGAIVYDHQANVASPSSYFPLGPGSIGQSFTPNLPSVDFVQLYLTNSGGAAIMYVLLWENSFTNGNLFGASGPVLVPGNFSGATNFTFSTPIIVTPGITYYLQPYVQSGNKDVSIGMDSENFSTGETYAGGTAYLNGYANMYADLWFSEGIVVPESHLTTSVTPGRIVAWGAVSQDVPTGSDFTQISVGEDDHCLALKSDGTVVAWGDNTFGQTNVPTGLSNIVSVAAGGIVGFNLVLKDDGTVVAWGNDFYGQTDVPAGLSNVIAISAGELHSMALKKDGTVVAWGDNGGGQTNVPSDLSNVVAIAAGQYNSLALKKDGTVIGWGDQATPPTGLTNVVAIAANPYSLALKRDGTIVNWIYPNVPTNVNGVVAISEGWSHDLAIRRDGTVAAWGDNYDGQTNVPPGLSNVVAIAAGTHQSLAITSDLKINSFKLVGQNPEIGFRAYLGQKYSIEYSSDLVSGNWFSLPGLIDGYGYDAHISDTNTTGYTQKFYRLKQLR
ncbi:MAG: RCC1 domain-containing protein [Limisphaerales bacterium]